MNRRTFLTTSGIALTTTLAGCSGSADDPESGAQGETRPDFEILSHRLAQGEYGNVGVVGTAVNNTDQTISYVQLEASFYAGQTRIGSGMANINNLQAGRNWEFEALYMGMDGDRVTDYQLDVSGTV